MILAFPLALVVAGFLVWRFRGERDGGGWAGFCAWAFAGALLTFSFLTGFTIGVFILPVAVAVLAFVASRAPAIRESLGLVLGAGVVVLLVGLLNRDYEPCPPGGRLWIPPSAPPGTSVSCGGMDPTPWLRSGVALCGVGLIAYVAARHLRTRSGFFPRKPAA